MSFDTSVPLTWSDVINIFMVVLTAITIIIAIVGNFYNRKQLKISLSMHEQSKNIDLFDRRLNLMNKIINSNGSNLVNSINFVEIELLFNKNILSMVQQKITIISSIQDIHFYIDEYIDILKKTEDFKFESIENIKMLFVDKEATACEKPGYKSQYKEFCDKYTYTGISSLGDRITYNYSDLSYELGKKHAERSIINDKLSETIKLFISNSIKKID